MELEDVYKDHTIKKGDSLRRNLHAVQRDAEDPLLWWVKGSGGTKYRVQVIQPGPSDDTMVHLTDEMERNGVRIGDMLDGKYVVHPADGLPFVSCTCPNGMNRGGRPQCYHSAAVLIILRDGTQDEHPVMESTDPLDENFVDDDTAAALKSQGFTDDEIEFLRS